MIGVWLLVIKIIMEKSFQKIEQEVSKFDTSRLSPEINQQEFFDDLKKLQVPCPWGDLKKGEGIEPVHPDLPDFGLIPYVPLGLALGCGDSPIPDSYSSITSADKFGKIVYSDIHDLNFAGFGDYMKLDLTKPETINLFGFKVQAIMSIAVFTYDGHGVDFIDDQNEMDAAKALDEMLMPGGIFATDSLNSMRFEKILIDKFGYTLVRRTSSIILQKPF